MLKLHHLDDLNDLYKVSFNKNTNNSIYRWKYFENPEGDAIVVGAFYENELVASGAMIPELFKIQNQNELIFKCTDLMTHPNHQKKGLSKKINELLREEIKRQGTSCCYTLCSSISTKSFLKNNWQYLGAVHNYFLPNALIKLKFLFLKSISYEFYNISLLSEEYLNIEQSGSNISKIKTKNYLTWRLSNPRYSYKTIGRFNADKVLLGRMIVSYSPGGVLNLIDIDASEDAVKNDLLHFAEKMVLNENLKGLVVMCIQHTNLQHYMRKKKYLQNPFKIGPLQSLLDFDILGMDSKRLELFTNPASWHLTGLNYDDI